MSSATERTRLSRTPTADDADDAAPLERAMRLPVHTIDRLGDVLQLVIGVFLLVVAAVVLFRTCSDLLTGSGVFATRITGAINGVLFVVIVLELLETIMSHFDGGGFQLQPFLVIGIISAVRHILTVGARLSLEGEGTYESFKRSQIELGVNAAVVVGLAIALILVRRSSASNTD